MGCYQQAASGLMAGVGPASHFAFVLPYNLSRNIPISVSAPENVCSFKYDDRLAGHIHFWHIY